jgi:hypothetical protein
MAYYKHVEHKILGNLSSHQMKRKGIINGAISRLPNKTIYEGINKA